MHTWSHSAHIGTRVGQSFVHAGNTILRAAYSLWRSWRSRREVELLLEADDHMLRDIGLTRGDVIGALAAAHDTDPSHHLIRARAEKRRARTW
jgi:uncharacterized protein YjiS (DUF1127 family)